MQSLNLLFFGTMPWAPMLIIFQCNLTGIESILSEISPLMTLISIVGAENSTNHPTETGFSDCREDFHNPNFDLRSHNAVALITVGKGSWKPRRAEVYVYPPWAHGQAPGKYLSHSSTSSGSWSGSSNSSGRSSIVLYLLRLCRTLRSVHLLPAYGSWRLPNVQTY